MTVRIQGKTSAPQTTRLAQDTIGDVRLTPYGEVMVQSGPDKGRCALAEEGAYFVAVNATPGTGVAGIAAADGYDATEALCTIRNLSTTKTITLDYIKLQCTVIGASGTDLRYDVHLDNIDRHTSGGTAIVEENTKVGGALSGADIRFGAIVAPAASADVLRLGGGVLRTVVMVVGDQYVFDFGGDPVQGSGAPQNGTLAAVLKTAVAPAVLAPNDTLVLTLNAASQAVTGASWEFEIGYWER